MIWLVAIPSGRSWSATPRPTQARPGTPECLASWSPSAFTPVPVKTLGADVLIDDFEDVEEAIDGLLSDFYVSKALKF